MANTCQDLLIRWTSQTLNLPACTADVLVTDRRADRGAGEALCEPDHSAINCGQRTISLSTEVRVGLFGGSAEKATRKFFAADTPREAQAQIAKGADINGFDVPGIGRMIPLARQAHQGNAAMVTWLLENGADPALQDATGDTALHIAANRGKVTVIPILVAGNADIEATDSRGNTPLHRSVMPGDLEATRVLLELGANPNARSEEGTPLSLAARGLHRNSWEMEQLLRSHGATQH